MISSSKLISPTHEKRHQIEFDKLYIALIVIAAAGNVIQNAMTTHWFVSLNCLDQGHNGTDRKFFTTPQARDRSILGIT
jgi:hypothetical protein